MDYSPAGDHGALASILQHWCVHCSFSFYLPPPNSCCSRHQRIKLADGWDCKTVNKWIPPPNKHVSWTFWVFRWLYVFVDTSGVCGCTSGFDKVNIFILFSCQVCVFVLWKGKRSFQGGDTHTHTQCVWMKAGQPVVWQDVVQRLSASENLLITVNPDGLVLTPWWDRFLLAVIWMTERFICQCRKHRIFQDF